MVLKFTHAGIGGSVDVRVARVEDASTIGTPAGTEGFPCCTASVAYPARGYGALLGWVQLVRSTDAGEEFTIDPLRFFEDGSAPHCFYGFSPTLFDAPSRAQRKPMDWLAHSFLAPIELFATERVVRPLLGFSWGFAIDAHGEISLRLPEALSPDDWDLHRPYLSRQFPCWTFARFA